MHRRRALTPNNEFISALEYTGPSSQDTHHSSWDHPLGYRSTIDIRIRAAYATVAVEVLQGIHIHIVEIVVVRLPSLQGVQKRRLSQQRIQIICWMGALSIHKSESAGCEQT